MLTHEINLKNCNYLKNISFMLNFLKNFHHQKDCIVFVKIFFKWPDKIIETFMCSYRKRV